MVVPANRFILLSLTGTPGTDFDLYLFNSSATTVYTDAGQVASSTGPTSTESITYGTQTGGTFYIDLNGASNVEGTFRLAVSIQTDTTPPRAQVLIDGGAIATNQQVVHVNLVATDDLSGVTQMQFSGDGTAWQPWSPYQPASVWSFPAGDGQKILYARVQDAAGNISSAVSASIMLDTLAPTILSRDPAPDSSTNLRPTFSVKFSEPIATLTWMDHGLLVQTADGVTLSGTYAWNASTDTGTFVAGALLVPGTVYVVTLGAITDLAGNPVAPIGSWLIHPLVTHPITLVASPGVVAPGGVVKLSGQVSNAAQTSYFVETQTPSGSWTAVAGFAVNNDGTFEVSTAVVANTVFRILLPGAGSDATSVSPSVRVLVRPQLSLIGLSSSATRTIARGTTVALRASVNPATPPAIVTLTASRYDSARRAWVVVTTIKRTTSHGIAAFSWRPTSAGSGYVRLTTAPTPLFANATSATYRWSPDFKLIAGGGGGGGMSRSLPTRS